MHLLIFLFCFACPTEGVTVREVVQANTSSFSRIWAIDARVSALFEVPDGATEKERELVEAQNCRYRYATLNELEYVHLERNGNKVVGEFTGRTYRVGTVESLNGPGVFRQLKNFDGALDENGERPADSPASGVLGDRQAAPVLVLARMHLGLEVFNPTTNSSEPLSKFIGESEQVNLNIRESKVGERVFEITANRETLDMMVTVNEEFGFAITSARVKTETLEHTMEYFDFVGVSEDVFLPRRFVNTVLNERSDSVLRMRGDIVIDRVNSVDIQQVVELDFPPMLPFTDLRTGQFGIWGNGSPMFYFQDEKEARAWDERRKLAARAIARDGNWNLWLLLLIAMVVSGGAWLARTQLLRAKST